MEVKKCNKCDIEYPMNKEYYYSDKSKKDGLTTTCKTCKNVSSKRYFEANKEKVSAYRNEYFAKPEVKERKRINDKEYRENNKEYYSDYFKKYYKKNGDSVRKKVREYQKVNSDSIKEKKKLYHTTFVGSNKAKLRKHKRRSLMSELPVGFKVSDWKDCLKHFGNSCAYCGSLEQIEQEHFVAVNGGGGYTKDNIITACLKCNRNKHDHDFFKWYPSSENYCEERKRKILEYLNIEEGVLL